MIPQRKNKTIERLQEITMIERRKRKPSVVQNYKYLKRAQYVYLTSLKNQM